MTDRQPTDRQTTLSDAVARHVQPGDALHIVVGHHRWTAAAREVVRQWWDRDPQFTLVMLSLSSLGALFFRGGLVRKVITGYSGDTFPNFTPNPWFADAYRSGAVEVEHWSFLAFAQRLEAGGARPARDRDPLDRGIVDGGERRVRARRLAVRRGRTARAAAARRRVAARAGRRPRRQRRAAAAAARRRVGRVGRAARRDRHGREDRRRPPAVVAPRADPRPPRARGRRDADWCASRRSVRGRAARSTATARTTTSGSRRAPRPAATTTTSGSVTGCSRSTARTRGSNASAPSGSRRCARRADADSWQADEAAYPPDLDAPVNGWERAAVFGARYLADRIVATDADAVLAGAGVANLSAWLGVALARGRGSDVTLTAEIGLWGYEPVPADPFVLNHRNFPSATMLTDAQHGARLARRRRGHDDDRLPRRCADRSARQHQLDARSRRRVPRRLGWRQRRRERRGRVRRGRDAQPDAHAARVRLHHVARAASVRALVTDLGLLEKGAGDELVLTAVPAGPEPIAERIERARAACGWDLRGRGRRWRSLPLPRPTRSARSGVGIPAAGSSAPAEGLPGTSSARRGVRTVSERRDYERDPGDVSGRSHVESDVGARAVAARRRSSLRRSRSWPRPPSRAADWSVRTARSSSRARRRWPRTTTASSAT